MREDCKFFDYCSAPLCPLDEERGLWYPDEEICRLKVSAPKWVKTQRKIAKLETNKDLYFSFQALEKMRAVRKGIKGVNPDATVSFERGRDKGVK